LPNHHEVPSRADRGADGDVRGILRKDERGGNRLICPPQLKLPDRAEVAVVRLFESPGGVTSDDTFDGNGQAAELGGALEQGGPVVGFEWWTLAAGKAVLRCSSTA
jgi:hypothetical protein